MLTFKNLLTLLLLLIFALRVGATDINKVLNVPSDVELIPISREYQYSANIDGDIQDVKIRLTGVRCKKKKNKGFNRGNVHMFGHGFTSKSTFWLNDIADVCRAGGDAYAFNAMGHGDSFDGIGKSEVLQGPKHELGSIDFAPRHMHEMVKHIKELRPSKKITYHGHSMGVMIFRLYAAGYKRDVVSGLEFVSQERRAYATDVFDRAILYGGPSDFREEKFLMKKIMQYSNNFSMGPLLNKALGGLGATRKEAMEAKAQFKSEFLKKLGQEKVDALMPALKLVLGGVMNMEHLTMQDLELFEKGGVSESVPEHLVDDFQNFKSSGYGSNIREAFHKLFNDDIMTMEVYGSLDSLAREDREIVQFLKRNPSANHLFVGLDEYGHIDIATGEKFRELFQPLRDLFVTEGISQNLLSGIKNVPGFTYLRGGTQYLNESCIGYLRHLLNSGGRKNTDADARRILRKTLTQ